jgi:hypothetical protein
MLNDPELLDHLQDLQRDIAQINRRMLIVVRFLNSALAVLLAAGTYVAVESWGLLEFWMRSSAITVLVIAYLILDRLFCRSEFELKPLSLPRWLWKAFQYYEQPKPIVREDSPRQASGARRISHNEARAGATT